MNKEGCLFCKIIKKELPSRIVHEDSDSIAFEDISPKAPVHIMVVPKQHIEKISDLDIENAAIAGKLLLVANKIAKEKGIAETGYRIVINCNKDAGQEIFHLHLHLLGGRKLTWPPG